MKAIDLLNGWVIPAAQDRRLDEPIAITMARSSTRDYKKSQRYALVLVESERSQFSANFKNDGH